LSNRFFRLPLAFDPDRLCADLTRCQERPWIDHFNTRDYEGKWTSVSLRSGSGSADDIKAAPGGSAYQDTPLVDACPYFRIVLDQFHCEMQAVRLLRLGPGSQIHEHRDPASSYADGFFRLHIPITTNPGTLFIVDGERLPMQPGECWYADFGLPHSVRNLDRTDRVHLIIDGLRNAWSDRLFEEAGYDFAEEARGREMSADIRREVIATLRARGSETDLRLATELEAAGMES
jgi:hypothetical protein